ncbi:chaplin [Streptomyces sp. NPDC059165]
MFRLLKNAGIVVAAGAAVIGGASVASADSGAQGVAVASPGVLSGNVIQVPVSIPVNACGNTLSIIGMLNPSAGNACGTMTASDGMSSTGAMAEGVAMSSPGVLSGNVIQVPVSIPVNACGNTLTAVGMLNPSIGNTCAS